MDKELFTENKRVLLGIGLVITLLVFTAGIWIITSEEEEEESGKVEIEDWNDLNDVRENLDEEYKLVNDLDAGTDGYDELVDTENGFEPIDDFTGSFDGNEHEISDLVIDRPSEFDVGLFGVTGETALIENVELINAEVTGENYVGLLVGLNNGTVTDSAVTGNVTGNEDVGGIVGDNKGEVSESSAEGEVTGEGFYVGGLIGTNSGTVSESSADATVDGDERVGGLIGQNNESQEYDIVENSFATGSVEGDSAVGGLVGQNNNEVSESSADVEVTGDYRVGGLVGFNNEATVKQSKAEGDVTGTGGVGGLVGYTLRGTITEAYATGSLISEDSRIGGLVGDNPDSGKISNSYWDKSVTGTNIEDGVGFGSGENIEGLETEQMQGSEAEANMDEFDFTDTWSTVEDDYPVLQVFE